MIKLKEELKELSDDSTDILKCHIIERYIGRPVCDKFTWLDSACLAQFASCYYKKSISENDYQPNDFQFSYCDWLDGTKTCFYLKDVLKY